MQCHTLLFSLCPHVTFLDLDVTFHSFYKRPCHIGCLQLLKWPGRTSFLTDVEPLLGINFYYCSNISSWRNFCYEVNFHFWCPRHAMHCEIKEFQIHSLDVVRAAFSTEMLSQNSFLKTFFYTERFSLGTPRPFLRQTSKTITAEDGRMNDSVHVFAAQRK